MSTILLLCALTIIGLFLAWTILWLFYTIESWWYKRFMIKKYNLRAILTMTKRGNK